MLTNKVMVFVLHLSQLAEVMVLCRKMVGQVVGKQYPLKTSGSDGLAPSVGKHILFDIVDPGYLLEGSLAWKNTPFQFSWFIGNILWKFLILSLQIKSPRMESFE